jgi:hypothetical protein
MRESRTYGSVRGARDETHVPTAKESWFAAIAHSRLWPNCDMPAVLTNVRSSGYSGPIIDSSDRGE